MSVEDQTPTDAQPETEPSVKKDVTVIAYGPNPDATPRMFAQALDQSRDYGAKVTKQNDSFTVSYEDKWGNEVTDSISESMFKSLVGDDFEEPDDEEALEYEVEVNQGTLKRETTFEETHKHTPSRAAKALGKRAVGDHLPDEVTGLPVCKYNQWYQTENNETKVRVSSRNISHRQVLVHQSKRDETDDRFETEEEYPAAEFSIRLDGTESEVETWSEEVVGPFMEAIAGMDGIQKVRLTDCKEKVEKEGDCFDTL